jgi:hypothetical protein
MIFGENLEYPSNGFYMRLISGYHAGQYRTLLLEILDHHRVRALPPGDTLRP